MGLGQTADPSFGQSPFPPFLDLPALLALPDRGRDRPRGNRSRRVVAGDSIQLPLDSDRVGLEMMMTGRLVGDTIRGRWTATESGAGLGRGPFLMVRLFPCDSRSR
jgi:hypothetical protein